MSLSITVIIVIINVIISFVAFQDENAFYKLCFWPERVWHEKEWIRILSGGFLHANLAHLAFNMIALYSFGQYVELRFMGEFGGAGMTTYIIFYILATVVANIPDLYQHKDDQYIRAVGASGAVSAVVFASILFAPLNSVYLFFIPIPIPAYLFGVVYLIYSAYMAKRQADNIGHLAHFSGAIFGIVFPLIFEPTLFMDSLHQITSKL
jgi:membrane associated rhomboid family serine protease